MLKIISSASKLVFVLVAIAVIILTFLKIVEAKDFMILAVSVFSYYFTRDKGESNTPSL